MRPGLTAEPECHSNSRIPNHAYDDGGGDNDSDTIHDCINHHTTRAYARGHAHAHIHDHNRIKSICTRNRTQTQRTRRSRHASRPPPHSTEVSSALPTAGTMSPRRRWISGKPRAVDPEACSRMPLVLLLLLALVAAPAAAVQIPVDNCLAPSYLSSKPLKLQWVPEFVDVVLDTVNPNHNLRITVWGNVAGSQDGARLPPPGDPYWTDPSQTDGKIVESEDGDRLTTLSTKLNFLTYTPFESRVDFCNSSLVNASCPLGPRFDVADRPYGLASFNLTHDLDSSYAFTSLWATFLIIWGRTDGDNVGCVSAVITPDLGGLASVLRYLPLMVLILTALTVPLAGILSPWGTTDIFHWTSNFGRDADLLRLVTPGFGDCLQYIQFIALTGALTLDYPGFFRPIVSQVAWSSLMFDHSFSSSSSTSSSPSSSPSSMTSNSSQAAPWRSVVDGIYVTKPNTTYGLEKQAQLIGLSEAEDIWPGMMVWLSVVLVSVVVLIQLGFALDWLYRKIKKIPEEDLRAKNMPFVVGNAVRIVFHFMVVPIVALSSFQLVIATRSPPYSVALAALTLALMLGFASWLLRTIITTKPKLVLFDDLATVLRYGPLYNTYSDKAASFALVPLVLNFVRGIAIGALQPSGVAQVVLLAICEVVQLLLIYAIRPFQSATSMNLYHSVFALLRLAVIMLMIAFAPSLGITEGPKGWLGYTILAIHAGVLGFGFFLSSFVTVLEVVARMLGAGGDDVTGLKRGGLSKIFGMRQLSRRVDHRKGHYRASQMSGTAMLDSDDTGRAGYVMPSGRIRSGSAASLGGMVAQHRQRSSSALDSIDMYTGIYRNVDSASSYMPGTPGEASTFSFLTSPGPARHAPLPAALPLESSDPYYRPPRRRRETLGESSLSEAQRGSLAAETKPAEPMELAAELSQGPTPGPTGSGPLFPANRPDYSTREVDFYYGVRGPALRSDGPSRKLGTGPADPNGPVATAAGWFRGFFGGKTKEKGKGFEVVRSSRMPPSMMARNGGHESPPEGIPVAMGVMRNGPIDSDDEDDDDDEDDAHQRQVQHRGGSELLTDDGDQSDSDAGSPVIARLPRGRLSEGAEAKLRFHISEAEGSKPQGQKAQTGEGSRISSSEDSFHDAPEIPRKSSKRQSVILSHASRSSLDTAPEPSPGKNSDSTLTPRLPFDRRGNEGPSSKSSLLFADEGGEGEDGRPLSYGSVPTQRINRCEPEGGVDLLGTYAEVVNEGRK